jgi:type IV fimbrial biogenesis protein FimT
MNSPQHRAGFTLTELLVVLAVLSVLAAASMPAFSALTARARMNQSVNELVDSFHLGRQISRLTGTQIALCPSADGRSCGSGDDWRQGWLLFTNTDGAEPPEPETTSIVRVVRRSPGDPAITSNRPYFILRNFGSRSTNGSFRYCHPQLPGMRRVVISYTGKPRSYHQPDAECPENA